MNMRILLTESCNGNCPHCFNKDMRKDGHMDTDKAILLFDYLARHTKGIKFMGGEPTIHPDFVMLYEYAQDAGLNVFLFTNALNDEILKIKPRLRDSITYNMALLNDCFNLDKLIPEREFSRFFETVINTKTNIGLLKAKIQWLIDSCERIGIADTIKFNLTLDCTENVFKNKVVLNKFYSELFRFIYDINPAYISFDHRVPPCFWSKESIAEIKKVTTRIFSDVVCGTSCYGLINASFELLHCNQYPVKIMDMFDPSGKNIVAFNKVETSLYKTNLEKQLIVFGNGVCDSCKYAVVYCQGGCLRHKWPAKVIEGIVVE